MSNESDRLIELASTPLADNAEHHLAAQAYLRRRLDEAAPDAAAIGEAIEVFEATDRSPIRKNWRLGFYGVAAVVICGILISSFIQVGSLVQVKSLTSLYRTVTFMEGSTVESFTSFLDNFSEKDRLLMDGDQKRSPDSDRWKTLWESDPDNSAYLLKHASHYFSYTNDLNDEILDAAKRIDPDNGWYESVIANNLAEKAVKNPKGTFPRTPSLATPVWEIIDSEKLESALDLTHRAANKSRLGSDGNGLISKQIELLPPRHDFASQMSRIIYLSTLTSYSSRTRKLADALAAGAQECAAKNDVEGFQRIKEDWEKISLKLTQEGTTLVDLLVAKGFLFTTVENFRDASKTLGLEEDFKRFDQLHELKKADKARKVVKGRRDPIQDLIRMRGSILASLSLPLLPYQTKSRVDLTESDLRPSRYTDHALVSRVFSIAALLPLGIVALLAWMHRFRQSPIHRGLSQRILDQVRLVDWIWTFTGGVLLPFLGYLTFVHFTTMSSREWSFKHTGFVHTYAEFLALLVMMLVLSPVIAAWRLNKRCKVFQLKSPRMWLGVVAAVGAMLAIPTAGWILSMPTFTNAMVYAASVLLILPILWLLGGCLVTLMDRHDEALRRGVLARVMVPVWVFAMVVMALSVPFHYEVEKHWVKLDRLFEIRPEAPAMSTYEWDVTQTLRAELLEIQR